MCQVCGWSGSKFGYSFAVSINAFFANDVCLSCGVNRRTRRMLEVLAEVADLGERLVIVDVGAAPATRQFFRRREHLNYLTVDLYKDSDIRSSITNIAFSDGAADVVMCCHVLEHVDDDRRGSAEMYRILKAGGLAIIMVPQRRGLAQTTRIAEVTFDGYGHIWDYGDDFTTRVEQVGFVLVSSKSPDERDTIHVFRK